MTQAEYDLVVIGSGPSGEKAAVEAARRHKTVAIVERRSVQGGVCLHTGTIPSKTLRETVVYIAGLRQRSVYGLVPPVALNVTPKELMSRKEQIISEELEVIRQHMIRLGIEVVHGSGWIDDPHTVMVTQSDGTRLVLKTAVIVIATGTVSYRPAHVSFDGKYVYDAETILDLDIIPRTMTIIGGGVIGCEYASIFSHLGVRVTIVDNRDRLLPFLDREIADTLSYLMRKYGVTLVLQEYTEQVLVENEQTVAVTRLGRRIVSDRLLYAVGRSGNTKNMGLEKLGIDITDSGLINVNEHYQTSVPNIYAVGDVIGFPSLASVSMDQGRLAAIHAFSRGEIGCLNSLLPFGIYTIPAVSIVGETEQSLTAAGQTYEIGTARYYELARGQIINDHDGMLKIIFEPMTKRILGVHIIGERATELIHIGQAVMSLGGTLDYFVETVFNYPTLGEAYKVAALDGLARVSKRA
jgi:NAD(P) transhydrogenase